MIAEILSTGDEMLLGDLVDTNSGWLCSRLKQLGIRVRRITTIGDDLDTISDTLRTISGRADICLATGGLGPTQDDLTSQAAANAAGEEVVMHQDAYASMSAYFKRRGFELTQENEKQAMLPASATFLENLHGTAPGFALELNNCLCCFMPGVPSEMKQMFDRAVLPRIREQFGLAYDLMIRRLTVFGLGESRVGALLNGFSSRFPQIQLGFRATFPCIEVKLVLDSAGMNPQDGEDLLREAGEWAVSQLENRVISLEGRSIQAEVGHLLREQGQTLAVAESCTGGLIANWITDVAGSSDYFLFSGVTYSNDAKMRILDVKEDTLVANGAVHEETALEMAKGARAGAGADWGISTTGIAGPGGGSDEKPVGTVCIGIAGPGVAEARRYHFRFDHRDRNKRMFAATALEKLRQKLIT